MKDLLNKIGKTVTVKEVPCSACIHQRAYTHCRKFHRDCCDARSSCTKTKWYTEMCVLTALIAKELENEMPQSRK